MKFVMTAACAAVWSSIALAQATTQSEAQQTPLVVASADTASTADQAPQRAPAALQAGAEGGMPPPNRFDALGVKGWDTMFPPTGDTLIGDAGGVRSALADRGIGFLGYSLNAFAYDLRGNNTPGANYNGRRPTYYMGGQGLFVTYDASRIGLNGGQFQMLLDANTNAANDINPPKTVNIGTLAYYQSFADNTFETKLGYLVLSQEFIGANVAGSFANGTLGPAAALVGVTGASFPGLSTPAVTFRYNGPNHFYDKIAVARSVPNEPTHQIFDNLGLGLRFSYPGAKALVINEFGYNRPSAPGQQSLWFRAGGIYNSTQYTNFETGGTSSNKGFYAGVDYQLTQPDSALPFRGIYAGVSATYAPPETNLYSRYYEARVYGLGVIPGRPLDMASLVATYNGISRAGLKMLFPGLNASSNTASVTATYAYHVMPGLFVQVGLGLVKNAELYPKVPWAIQSYLSINMLF